MDPSPEPQPAAVTLSLPARAFELGRTQEPPRVTWGAGQKRAEVGAVPSLALPGMQCEGRAVLPVVPPAPFPTVPPTQPSPCGTLCLPRQVVSQPLVGSRLLVSSPPHSISASPSRILPCIPPVCLPSGHGEPSGLQGAGQAGRETAHSTAALGHGTGTGRALGAGDGRWRGEVGCRPGSGGRRWETEGPWGRGSLLGELKPVPSGTTMLSLAARVRHRFYRGEAETMQRFRQP